jgi:tRNA-splicing ligase RtcB
MRLKTYGPVEDKVLAQMQRCLDAEDGARGVLCADNHLGYSMPIGGVVAYRSYVSPSAVGYDIGCGNLAVKTDMMVPRRAQVATIMDDIARLVSFGVGRNNPTPVDHPVLDAIARSPVAFQQALAPLAARQLGTVGSGNHYVDLFSDENRHVWIGVHFGSRGFGHKTATWAFEQAGVTNQSMDAPPTLIPLDTALGADYLTAMNLAGEYARAGRQIVVETVVRILGAYVTDVVQNHHNFAWTEYHGDVRYLVHRKGATPNFPDVRSFVGGHMASSSVILRGRASDENAAGLYSTMHGAGRVLSRTRAAGKRHRKTGEILVPGEVRFDEVRRDMASYGIELRGAGADEAPDCYRSLLSDVLPHHAATVQVETLLSPIGVAMAGADVQDPYKD